MELESTFFLDKGVPQSKLISISVIMLLPNSKSTIIATANIDLIQNFGDDFSTSEIAMEPTKDSRGCICKTFKYTATIAATKKNDLINFEQCVNWRKTLEERKSE